MEKGKIKNGFIIVCPFIFLTRGIFMSSGIFLSLLFSVFGKAFFRPQYFPFSLHSIPFFNGIMEIIVRLIPKLHFIDDFFSLNATLDWAITKPWCKWK